MPASNAPIVRTRTVAVAAVVAALVGLLPATASAGRYRALLCETPAGRNVPVEGLTFTTNGPSGFTTRNTCGTDDGVIGLGLGSSARFSGQYARATLPAPRNLSFYGMTITHRTFTKLPVADQVDAGATPAWKWSTDERGDGQLVAVRECLIVTSCLPNGWSTITANGYGFQPTQRAITWEVACIGTANSVCAGTGEAVHRVYGELQRINVGLEDQSSPAGTVRPAELPAAIPRTALLPLSIAATDVGGGVLDASATLGGVPAGLASLPGACSDRGNVAGLIDYESLVPCPSSATLDLVVDPKVVPDGTHTLKVTVRDAAGNATVVAERQVVVGDPALGPPQAQVMLERGEKPYRARYGRKVVVRGKLLRLDGVPIGGAALAVQQQPTVPGGAWEPAGSLTTAPDGSFAFEPKATGSRTLRFAYSSATAQTSLIVRAGMRIEAVRRTIKRPGTLRLRGRVLVEPLPKAGAFIEVQLRDGQGWRTIGSRRTDQQGDWEFSTPLRGRGTATYVLRAKLRKLPTVPSEPATSGEVRVRVR